MSEQKEQTMSAKSGIKGIILTIEENGRVNSQILGRLNEAEFLGLGTYLSNILLKDGIMALSDSQIVTLKSIEKLGKTVTTVMQEMKGEERNRCGKESCSDCSHLLDSTQSLENCPKVSEE